MGSRIADRSRAQMLAATQMLAAHTAILATLTKMPSKQTKMPSKQTKMLARPGPTQRLRASIFDGCRRWDLNPHERKLNGF